MKGFGGLGLKRTNILLVLGRHQVPPGHADDAGLGARVNHLHLGNPVPTETPTIKIWIKENTYAQ